MALGQRLKQARMEAGLSQRQLCGEVITRNMLSQIENGGAQPSVSTLQYLASRLGKTVSFFLEEDAVTSPNQAVMAKARECYREGDAAGAVQILQDYRSPDQVFDEEFALLSCLCLMGLARKALEEDKAPFAARLLEQAGEMGGMYGALPERDRLLLLAGAKPLEATLLAKQLPCEDEALLLRARAALESGDSLRSAEVLRACEDRTTPIWNLLMGDAIFAQREYTAAAACYQKAEEYFPKETCSKLEACYRELGDFRKAYEYACKQR